MHKISFFLFGIFVLLGCNNDEQLPSGSAQPLQVNAEFLKLEDSGDMVAGELKIISNCPEVSVRWNTDSICNLDVSQTKIEIKNGKGILPIKWSQKYETGKSGPESAAFKAGVLLTAGEHTQYIPLIWAERIDSTEIMKNIQTRAVGDVMPRVALITLLPTTVNLNDQVGGSMYVGLTDVPYVIFDYSEIISDFHIDMSKLPNNIWNSQILDFTWTAAGSPKYSFSAHIIARTEGLSASGIVNFEYSGESGGQEPEDGIECGGVVWGLGSLQYANGVYSFSQGQDQFTGVNEQLWNALTNPDYFSYNTLIPTTTSLNNGDPCSKVAPAGKWRLPTKTDIEALVRLPYKKTVNSKGVLGYFFNVSEAPTQAEEGKTLFFPLSGFRFTEDNRFYCVKEAGYYWSSTSSNTQEAYYLYLDPDYEPMVTTGRRNSGFNIRCVKR